MSKLLLIRDPQPCQIHGANQTYGHPCTTNQILAAGERGRHCYKSSRIQPQADEPRCHHVRPPPKCPSSLHGKIVFVDETITTELALN